VPIAQLVGAGGRRSPAPIAPVFRFVWLDGSRHQALGVDAVKSRLSGGGASLQIGPSSEQWRLTVKGLFNMLVVVAAA
jgi:hypothetical protein